MLSATHEPPTDTPFGLFFVTIATIHNQFDMTAKITCIISTCTYQVSTSWPLSREIIDIHNKRIATYGAVPDYRIRVTDDDRT